MSNTIKTAEEILNDYGTSDDYPAYHKDDVIAAMHQYHSQFEGLRWVKASERLPEIVDKKATPRFVKVRRKNYEGKEWIQKAVAFYFPEHFKTVEWEDWDDYNQADFPYTEEDADKGIVWLRPGWYSSIECNNCDGYWSRPLDVIEWQTDEAPLPSTKGEDADFDVLWDKCSEYIDDDSFSFSNVAGSSVITKSGFKKLVELLSKK